jgi:hypothetical protein
MIQMISVQIISLSAVSSWFHTNKSAHHFWPVCVSVQSYPNQSNFKKNNWPITCWTIFRFRVRWGAEMIEKVAFVLLFLVFEWEKYPG